MNAQIAGESTHGCAPFDLDNAMASIRTVRSQADHVIVSLHWGYQYDRLPSPEQVHIAHNLIDAGAVIVHGHHPHVLQAIERYGRGIILYSLGNFIFPDFLRTDGLRFRFPAQSRRTGIVICELDGQGVHSHEFVPLRVTRSYHINAVRGRARARAINRIVRLGKVLLTKDHRRNWQQLHEKTYRFRMEQESMYATRDRFARRWRHTRLSDTAALVKKASPRHLKELARVLWHKLRELRRVWLLLGF